MERKIPLKNYIILMIIVVLFVLLVFYMRDWYKTASIYYNGGSLMLDVATQVNKEELNNYAQENPNFILYVSSGDKSDIKKFESKLKKYIIQNNISSIVYLNVDEKEISNFNEYLKTNFVNNSSQVKKITDSQNVTIYSFENGIVTNIIENADKKSINSIGKIFKKYGVDDNA